MIFNSKWIGRHWRNIGDLSERFQEIHGCCWVMRASGCFCVCVRWIQRQSRHHSTSPKIKTHKHTHSNTNKQTNEQRNQMQPQRRWCLPWQLGNTNAMQPLMSPPRLSLCLVSLFDLIVTSFPHFSFISTHFDSQPQSTNQTQSWEERREWKKGEWQIDFRFFFEREKMRKQTKISRGPHTTTTISADKGPSKTTKSNLFLLFVCLFVFVFKCLFLFF